MLSDNEGHYNDLRQGRLALTLQKRIAKKMPVRSHAMKALTQAPTIEAKQYV